MKLEIDSTAITIVPDPVHGSQVIQIQATEFGLALAQTLGTVEQTADGYVVQHTAAVDLRILALVDLLISIRYNHPTYTQLSFGLRGRQ